MTTSENPPQEAALDSIFPELRAVPHQTPRRELLAGLKWKAALRSPLLVLGPLVLLFTLFPLVIFATVGKKLPARQRLFARVIQVEHFKTNQTFVKYRYEVEGRPYLGASAGIGASLLSNLRRGDELQISFEKNQPQNSAPAFETWESEDFPLAFLFFFPLMAAFFFAPFFIPQLRSLLLARKLFARGSVTNGKLRFVRSGPIQTPAFPGGGWQLIYEFFDSNGTLHRGCMRCDNPWLVQQLPPDSPVVVAYNSRKPAQNVLLEPYVA